MNLCGRSGRLIPNIELNLECLLHFIKSGNVSYCDLGILDMILYGCILSGVFYSMVKGR